MNPWTKSVIQLGCACLASLALGGCGAGLPASGPVLGSSFQGVVRGGQQPIYLANIQLYAAGSTGYGSAYTYTTGTSLLGSHTVTTGMDGSYSITSDYTCPSASTPVYLVATGGSPGLANNAINSHIALMVALGPCGGLGPSTQVALNEATTVASVWALAPFMTGIANVGTNAATNATGLSNAFATVNKLVNTATGAISGPALPSNAVLPVSKLNFIADILASCVNSPGGIAGDSTACGTLFRATTVNGVAPTDTITAAMNLAQLHGISPSALAGLVTPTSPFQPSVSQTPTDFSVVIQYSGGGLSSPKGIAVDATGNVWTANSGNNSVSEFSNVGVPLSTSSGYTVGSLNLPSSIAVDPSGNAWVTNKGNSTVSKIAPLGTSGTPYSGGNLSQPSSVAVDGSGNVWVSNAADTSVTEISAGGTVSSYAGASLSSPVSIAITPK